MSLHDVLIRKSDPKTKPYKISDGGGLHLLIQPNGTKLWRLKYRFAGKESLLSFGPYPAVTIAEARNKQYVARASIEAGQNPRHEFGRNGLGQTFEQIARLWHENRKDSLDPEHASRVISRLDHDVFPSLGQRPIRYIKPPEVLAMLRQIEARGALEICRRAKQSVSQIFRFAIASGWADNDPTACLDDALRPRPVPHHMNRISSWEMSAFLRKLAGYDEECPRRRAVTRNAIMFTLLTWARTKEVRFATAAEFDLSARNPSWRIPARRMKMGREHIIPLSREAAAIVRAMLGQRRSGFVFTLDDGAEPISQHLMINALYRMGYRGRQTVHGFRGLASTWANEALIETADPRNPARRYHLDWIELQLAHVEANGVRRAYNAAQYIVPRRFMLQDWADQVTQWTDASAGEGDSDDWRT